MLKSIISFSLLYWFSYFLWIYSQISSNSSNVVFSIIFQKICRKSFWIMRNQNTEKIETNKWTRLLVFDDKIIFYFPSLFFYILCCRYVIIIKKNSENVWSGTLRHVLYICIQLYCPVWITQFNDIDPAR